MWRWPSDSDAACPCRSIWVVLLIDTTWSFCMMMCGELVYSTGQQCMSRLRSSVAYSCVRAEGKRVDHLARIQLLSCAGDRGRPCTARRGRPSSSRCGRRGRARRFRAAIAHTALGMAPMPICRQSPSSISDGDEPPDRGVDVTNRRIRQLRRRGIVVAFDHVVHFADVEAGLLAVDVRQPLGSSRR